MRKLIVSLVLGLSLTLAIGVILSRAEPGTPLRTLSSGHHFLPPYPNPHDRFGFDSVGGAIANYDVAQLNAGWYSNWRTSLNPAHPDGLTYVQLIRLYAGQCPPVGELYEDPAEVMVEPSRSEIAEIAAAHPGSLWLIGNEPDSCFQRQPVLPEVYAHVYHEYYNYIKGLDPTAIIANGGVVQPTPCRLEYLDIVWDTYQQAYGEPIPVDVWNIHAFILYEDESSSGARWPPGVDPGCAIDYPIRDADNIDVFRGNLIDFREWMKNKGEQDKPLIITEYGILWPGWLLDEDGRGWSFDRVSHFMTRTFDLFLNETFPTIGYPADDHRLVQAWAWFSTFDDRFNGDLFYGDSGEITPIGQAYADYTSALSGTQYTDLAVQLQAGTGPLERIPPTATYDALTVTLPVTGAVTNLGKAPATGVVIASPLLGFQVIQDFPARYERDEIPLLSLPPLTLTQSGVYALSLVADPGQTLADPRRFNNALTITVDARSDLLIPVATGYMHARGPLGRVVGVTLTVANEGVWPAPPVSGTLYLSTTQGTPLAVRHFSISVIGSSARVTTVETLDLDLPHPSDDFLPMTVDVDSGGVLDEQGEDNNWAEMMIPVVMTTTLEPDVTSVLTSASEHLTFSFPAGTVLTPTDICLTPRLPSELPPGPPQGVAAFTLTAYRYGQPVTLTSALPITVTWRYTDMAVEGLDEPALDLYRLKGGRWERVPCSAQQRHPEENQLITCIQQLGNYVFGQRYEHYLPLVLVGGVGADSGDSEAQPSTPDVAFLGTLPH